MSIPTAPPASPVPPAASGAAGFGRGAATAVDSGAPLRVLVAEIRSAAVATLGAPAAIAPAPTAGATPEVTAPALSAWLNSAAAAAAAADGTQLAHAPVSSPAARAALLTAIVEEGYARALPQLGASATGVAAATDLHDLLLAALVDPGAPPPPAHVPDIAAGLRILVEEVRATVTADLDLPALPSAAAMTAEPGSVGGDPGNVAAQMLGWLRAVAASAGLTPAELRQSVEQGALRAVEALAVADAGGPIHAAVTRAQTVVLAGLALEATVSAAVPQFRPDIVQPVTVRDRPREGRAPRRRPALPARGEPPFADTREVVAGDDERARLTGPDLKGPMELIRRYFEDFHSSRPGACARHFVLPAGFWGDGRWTGQGDAVALATRYSTLREALAAEGVSGGRILMLRAEPVASDVAMVYAVMTREAAGGTVLEEIEVAYTTVRTAAGWRIAAVIRR